MLFNESTCCAVTEIASLAHYAHPARAMKAFCESIMEDSIFLHGTSAPIKDMDQLGAFYIFTAVIREGCRRYKYGHDFAAYIKKHDLGPVVESPAAANRANHPDHLVKVWIWHPHKKRLFTWWKANREK